ncbi:hypothetical protein L2E82_14323 [Cichorium intybus]|uniref:Uncharacterized protein n=1 Tax=Cichorium intybus TaxID=13427 RepID=A0ACB9F033_CICIN|nr:hypothetical protein L2E82_14323 [Cichorium intybus]
MLIQTGIVKSRQTGTMIPGMNHQPYRPIPQQKKGIRIKNQRNVMQDVESVDGEEMIEDDNDEHQFKIGIVVRQ